MPKRLLEHSIFHLMKILTKMYSTTQPKNVADLLQVVNFAGLLSISCKKLVNFIKLQQACFMPGKTHCSRGDILPKKLIIIIENNINTV